MSSVLNDQPKMNTEKQQRGFASIGLFNPKNELNVGMIMRAASCYDVRMVAIQGRRFKSCMTDPNSTHLDVPVIETKNLWDVIPHGAVTVAVEFIQDATSLVDYVHPDRAFYILGPEDGNISNEILQKCRDIVYVPTKACMNLAATANVLLYDRLCKQMR